MHKESHIWEYSFDLDVNALKKYYGKPTYTHAYDEIARYLKRIGFDNKNMKQGSCYFTSKEYSSQDILKAIRVMFDQMPWLQLCLRTDSLTIKENNFYQSNRRIQRNIKTKAFKQSLNAYYEKLGVPNPLEKSSLDKKLNCAKAKMANQKRTQKSYDRGKEREI